MNEPPEVPPAATRRRHRPPAEALHPDELRRILLFPPRVLAAVLPERERLAATIAAGRHLWLLIVALLAAGALLGLPFGAVLDLERFWSVTLLFLGPMLICFPSLHIFAAYVGSKASIAQTLALSSVISCVAAVFALGFFPVMWFLEATMSSGSTTVTPAGLGLVLLGVSVLAGIGQLFRCLALLGVTGRDRRPPLALVTGWQLLFVYISYRMAVVLELL